MGRRWGVTCPSRLTSPPETPFGELGSEFPSPSLLAPRVLRGGQRPLWIRFSDFTCPLTVGPVRQKPGEAIPQQNGPGEGSTPCSGNGEVGTWPEGSSWGTLALLASQTHLEEMMPEDAAEPTCSRCHCFRGGAPRAVLPALTCLTCRPCCLPRNLSQQAGRAGFAKQHGSWVWPGCGQLGTQ